MAKNIIGFNSEDDFDRMSRSVRKSENTPQTGQRQRRLYPVNTGGGGEEIMFQIVSADCTSDPKSAVVDILFRDCKKNKASEEDDSGQVTVYDELGCNFDEPEGDLVERKGLARYMKSAAGGNPAPECKWVVKFICCDEDSCG